MVLDENNTAPVLADSPLCETCSALDLDQIFREGVGAEDPITLGVLTTILGNKRTCGLCRLISHLISRSWCLDRHPDEDLKSVQVQFYAVHCGYADVNQLPPGVGPLPTCAHRIYLIASRPSTITRMVFQEKIKLSMELQMMEESAARVGPVVSIERIKSWMRICEKEHGPTCASVWRNRNVTDELPAGARMIDVVKMAIVKVPRGCRYVALSYVWGDNINSEAYKTVSMNVAQRSQRGSLEGVELPRTICDAIKLVRKLGERYLWVDAMCIIQDDADDKATQIAGMHLIYGLAVLTILNAGSSSVITPLPGLEPGSRPELQHIERIQSLSLAVPLRMLTETLAASKWNTRGWTFQEVILSRRRLFFTNEQVFFQCQRDVFSEDVISESSTETALYPGYRSSNIPGILKKHALKGFVDPNENDNWSFTFQQIIESYTRRLLTDPADIYNAVFAILTMFFSHLDVKEAFLFGMLVSTFEDCMLWQPALDAPAHARRVISELVTPSWSWIGWEGPVTYGIDGEEIVGFLSNPANASQSLVDEWVVGDPEGRARWISTGRHLQRSYSPPERSLKYLGLPNLSGASLVEEGGSLAPGMLLFRTTRAFLRIRRVELPVDIIVKLDEGRREHYGSKYHSVFEILSDGPLPATMGRVVLPSDTDTLKAPLEFVVLSRCNGRGNSDTFDRQVFGTPYVDCLLNVMVVKLAGKRLPGAEVSERVGVGVIAEAAWAAATIEERVVWLQ